MAAVAGFNATIEATDSSALDMLYVKSISFGGTSAADVDITHLTSADAIREFVRGTKNPGRLVLHVFMTVQFTMIGMTRFMILPSLHI